jgi:ABC-2 type transport system permease protein
MFARDTLVMARFGARIYWRDRGVVTTAMTMSLVLGVGLPFLMSRLGADLSRVLGLHVGMIAMLLVSTALNQTTMAVVVRRDQLILKRLRTTGLADRDILGGEILNVAAQSVGLIGLVSVVLYTLTDLTVPRDLLLFGSFTVAGAVVLAMLGAAWTAAIRRAELAGMMTMPFFLLTAGGMFDADQLPGWVGPVLDLLPTTAVVDVALVAYRAEGTFVGDLRAAALPAATLAVWALIALVAIRLWFRWEPRKS